MGALAPTITDASVTLTWGAAGQYYGYCTLADVGYEFPNSANYITLTPSAIGQEISNASQQMHEVLGHVYQMPYAGSDAGILFTLRDINAKLATALLIERYYTESEPNLSGTAAERRAAAMLRITDVVSGVTRWDTPFGDAVGLAQNPVYNQATGATITPNANALDGSGMPVFSMRRTRFRGDGIM